MQVFLPLPSSEESVKVLDGARLRKGIVEGFQILEVLKNGGAWQNHPAVKMFRGFESILAGYCLWAIDECERRGWKTSILKPKILSHLGGPASFDKLPPWWGNEEFHASHRSNLLRKGRTDSICERWRRHYKRPINEFLKERGFPEKHLLKIPDIQVLEHWAKEFKLPQIPNHYAQFGWTESDNLPYVWPV